MSGELLNAALAYATRGWPVFPCVARGKEPAIRRGFYAATTNPETIRRLWRRGDLNIGIPTGSSSGIWTIDVDGPTGAGSLRELEARHGALPATRQVITARGRHLWFAYSGEIKSSAGRIGPGIDVRGDRACTMAPPSIHPSGHVYAWASLIDDVAVAPGWLIELARKRPTPTISERALANMRGRRSAPGAYGAAALADEIATLAATAPGGRNHALNRAAFSLFQLVAGGELERDEVVAQLINACQRNGLIKDDGLPSVIATIRSGAGAGAQRPRSRGAA